MELRSDQARRLAQLLVTDLRARELAWLLMNNEEARQLARRVIGVDTSSQPGWPA